MQETKMPELRDLQKIYLSWRKNQNPSNLIQYRGKWIIAKHLYFADWLRYNADNDEILQNTEGAYIEVEYSEYTTIN